MIVRAGETIINVAGGCAIDEDIMSGLYVEGFLDLGVWGDEEMNKRDGEEKEGERMVCIEELVRGFR